MSEERRFHPLVVGGITPLTDDSVAVDFDASSAPPGVFDFLPGQHLTLRRVIDGEDVRRSYSICAPPGRLRVGVKRLAGGKLSTWMTESLRVGDIIDSLPPSGEFTVEVSPSDDRRRAAIVAGSGITPVLSLVSATLAASPTTRWTVMYGNRETRTVMFLDELEALKDRHPERLQIVHVLSREDTGLDLTTGRIDGDRLERLWAGVIDGDRIDDWYLCGPYRMIDDISRFLAGMGVGADRVHHELFFAGPPTSVPPPPDDEPDTVQLRVTVDGRSTTTRMRRTTSILDAALAVRPDLPYSCKGGMCASCKAQVVEGAVTMEKNWALVSDDLAGGFVLTCQAHPTSPTVAVDFDRR